MLCCVLLVSARLLRLEQALDGRTGASPRPSVAGGAAGLAASPATMEQLSNLFGQLVDHHLSKKA